MARTVIEFRGRMVETDFREGERVRWSETMCRTVREPSATKRRKARGTIIKFSVSRSGVCCAIILWDGNKTVSQPVSVRFLELDKNEEAIAVRA